MASNEHDDQEVLVQSLCAFVLGLCVVFNNDSNINFSKVRYRIPIGLKLVAILELKCLRNLCLN